MGIQKRRDKAIISSHSLSPRFYKKILNRQKKVSLHFNWRNIAEYYSELIVWCATFYGILSTHSLPTSRYRVGRYVHFARHMRWRCKLNVKLKVIFAIKGFTRAAFTYNIRNCRCCCSYCCHRHVGLLYLLLQCTPAYSLVGKK